MNEKTVNKERERKLRTCRKLNLEREKRKHEDKIKDSWKCRAKRLNKMT